MCPQQFDLHLLCTMNTNNDKNALTNDIRTCKVRVRVKNKQKQNPKTKQKSLVLWFSVWSYLLFWSISLQLLTFYKPFKSKYLNKLFSCTTSFQTNSLNRQTYKTINYRRINCAYRNMRKQIKFDSTSIMENIYFFFFLIDCSRQNETCQSHNAFETALYTFVFWLDLMMKTFID